MHATARHASAVPLHNLRPSPSTQGFAHFIAPVVHARLAGQAAALEALAVQARPAGMGRARASAASVFRTSAPRGLFGRAWPGAAGPCPMRAPWHPPHSACSTPQGSRHTAQHLQRARSSQLAFAPEDFGGCSPVLSPHPGPNSADAAANGSPPWAPSGAAEGGPAELSGSGGGGDGDSTVGRSACLQGHCSATRLSAVGSTRLCTAAILQASAAPGRVPALSPASQPRLRAWRGLPPLRLRGQGP
jgi:hypothetical protein